MANPTYWCELTVTPGLSEYDESVKVFDSRTNYPPTCTVYTFSNRYSVKMATKHLENAGYIVRKRDSESEPYITKHDVVYSGTTIAHHG